MEVNLTTDLNLVLGIEQVDLIIYQAKLLQIIDYIVLCYRLAVFLTSLPATSIPAAFLPKGKTSH